MTISVKEVASRPFASLVRLDLEPAAAMKWPNVNFIAIKIFTKRDSGVTKSTRSLRNHDVQRHMHTGPIHRNSNQKDARYNY